MLLPKTRNKRAIWRARSTCGVMRRPCCLRNPASTRLSPGTSPVWDVWWRLSRPAKARLETQRPAKASRALQSRWSGGVISGVIGTVALAAWKFKVIGLAALTKGKILLLGLTKASTFVSMFAFMGVYWTEFGGWLALGLVLSIYVHEMGHVFSLLRYGVGASAALFIPGLGAVVRLNQALVDPKQDARVGLAGPIWGTAAALACAGVYELTDRPIWAAIAKLGAIINLFNLLPFWQLDGARAFRSLNRSQRLAGRRRDGNGLGRHRPVAAGFVDRRRRLAHDIGQALRQIRRPDCGAVCDFGADPLGSFPTVRTDRATVKRQPQPIACRFLFEIESDIAKWRRRILSEVSLIETEG